MMIRALLMNPTDNVAVVVQDTHTGDEVDTPLGKFTAAEEIRTGHKMAIAPIAKGASVIKYGIAIGRAGQDIQIGDWVHTHNVIDTTEESCNAYAAAYRAKIKEARGT